MNPVLGFLVIHRLLLKVLECFLSTFEARAITQQIMLKKITTFKKQKVFGTKVVPRPIGKIATRISPSSPYLTLELPTSPKYGIKEMNRF